MLKITIQLPLNGQLKIDLAIILILTTLACHNKESRPLISYKSLVNLCVTVDLLPRLVVLYSTLSYTDTDEKLTEARSQLN